MQLYYGILREHNAVTRYSCILVVAHSMTLDFKG
jgi:hypothetical protein